MGPWQEGGLFNGCLRHKSTNGPCKCFASYNATFCLGSETCGTVPLKCTYADVFAHLTIDGLTDTFEVRTTVVNVDST